MIFFPSENVHFLADDEKKSIISFIYYLLVTGIFHTCYNLNVIQTKFFRNFLFYFICIYKLNHGRESECTMLSKTDICK